MSLNNLAQQLKTQFPISEQLQDIDESISYHQEAVTLRPVGHRGRPNSLKNLSDALLARFGRTGNPSDSEQADVCRRGIVQLMPGIHFF